MSNNIFQSRHGATTMLGLAQTQKNGSTIHCLYQPLTGGSIQSPTSKKKEENPLYFTLFPHNLTFRLTLFKIQFFKTKTQIHTPLLAVV